jgi:hypothetical protein
MSPRRRDSEETLFDGSADGSLGYEKLDCTLSFFLKTPRGNSQDL